MQWDELILKFYKSLQPPVVPDGYEVLFPFSDEAVWRFFEAFYQRYYADDQPRYLMVGINPGRFGAGVTGIPFTDPIRLKDSCGIDNPWVRKPELSSIFMYEMMEAFGGIEKFYAQFYITAVSPLGYLRDGKNVNYYDDRKLADAVLPFAADCMQQQLNWPAKRAVCFCIGEGKNLQYLQQLNADHKWFEAIEALPHPRFIMQYKRLQLDDHIKQYLDVFSKYGIMKS
jgi:hypothetical protein